MSKPTFLDRRHPGWVAMEKHWRLCIETFEGGPEWMVRNIFKFHKEGKKEYANRLARAYRDNISRDVCEVYTAHLFKAGVERDEEGAPAGVVRFLEKATRGHNARPLTEFMRSASDKSNAVSPVFLLVDMPASDVRPVTVADEQALGLAPYVYALWPTDVLNFGITPDGDFTWALIREDWVDDSDPLADEQKAETRYRLWTRDSWSLYRKKDNTPELIESQPHPLGVVPLVRLVHKEHDSVYKGTGLVDEIVYKDRAIANYESCLGCIIYDQAFSTLFIPDKAVIAATEADTEGRRRKVIQMATNRAVTFNDQAQHVPFYASPDAEQAKLILETTGRLRVECWEDALLGSESNNKAGGPMTATQAEFEFEKLNGALADNAANLEAADRQVIRLAGLWMGERLTDDQLNKLSKYPRRFNVQALIDAITELLGFQKFPQLGETFWAKALGRLAERYLGDLTPEESKQVQEEIAEHFQLNQLVASAPLFDRGIPSPAGDPPPKE